MLSRTTPNARPRSSDEVMSRIRGSQWSAAQMLCGAGGEGAAVGLAHWGLALKRAQQSELCGLSSESRG